MGVDCADNGELGARRFRESPVGTYDVVLMKQNAAGLASICILCTMILVTVSTTVSLYSGLEDVVRTQYPHELTAYVSGSAQARDAALAAVRAAAAKIDAQAEIRSYRLHAGPDDRSAGPVL